MSRNSATILFFHSGSKTKVASESGSPIYDSTRVFQEDTTSRAIFIMT